jgi:hypothetical protein
MFTNKTLKSQSLFNPVTSIDSIFFSNEVVESPNLQNNRVIKRNERRIINSID